MAIKVEAVNVEAAVRGLWVRWPTSGEPNENFVRHRVSATKVDMHGLDENHTWNKTPNAEKVCKDRGERAVLVQCRRHYQELAAKFPSFADQWFDERSGFGEQMTIDGMDAETVCIGDVIGFDGSPLALEVSFPRLACFRVDKRYSVGLRSGLPGTVRQWVSANARGGFFCRVRTPGSVGEGDKLKVLARPNPGWTLERLAGLCYPKSPVHLTFAGTDEELQELCEMESLGFHEWKDRLHVARAQLLETFPMMLPRHYGSPVPYAEGLKLVSGEWHIDGWEGIHPMVLEFDGTQVFRLRQGSGEVSFGSTQFIGIPDDEEEMFMMDVEIASLEMRAALFKTEKELLLVIGSGAVWRRRLEGKPQTIA